MLTVILNASAIFYNALSFMNPNPLIYGLIDIPLQQIAWTKLIDPDKFSDHLLQLKKSRAWDKLCAYNANIFTIS